jgi:hypothetical protein
MTATEHRWRKALKKPGRDLDCSHDERMNTLPG